MHPGFQKIKPGREGEHRQIGGKGHVSFDFCQSIAADFGPQTLNPPTFMVQKKLETSAICKITVIAAELISE